MKKRGFIQGDDEARKEKRLMAVFFNVAGLEKNGRRKWNKLQGYKVQQIKATREPKKGRAKGGGL